MIYNSFARHRMALDHHRQRILATWEEKEKQILSHPETWVAEKKHFAEKLKLNDPFKYVTDLFPKIKKGIEESRILVNENTYFWWNTMGLPHEAAGLYVPSIGVILLSRNVPSPLNLYVVMVHELLHRASHLLGQMGGEHTEEHFAFSYSIDYLRKEGIPEFLIIEKYLMPYCLYKTCEDMNIEKATEQAREVSLALATSMCHHKTGEVIEGQKSSGDIWDII